MISRKRSHFRPYVGVGIGFARHEINVGEVLTETVAFNAVARELSAPRATRTLLLL